MLRLRPEHVEALRPVARAEFPKRFVQGAKQAGLEARIEVGSGDAVVTDKRGLETRVEFSRDGLPKSTARPSGATQHYEYDSKGRLASIVYPDGEKVSIERDARGNVKNIERPGLVSYGFEHDQDDRLVTVKYPDGTHKQFDYHSSGNLSRITDRTGATTIYRRSSDGRLEAVVDPLGRETRYNLDRNRLLESVTFPDGSVQEFGHEPDLQVFQVVNRDGGLVHQELDENGRVYSIVWEDDEYADFEFEGSNLSGARNEQGSIDSRFDGQGNPLEEKGPDDSVVFEYDAEGRVTAIKTQHSDTIAYEYDEDGRPSSVLDWEGRAIRFVWDPNSTVREIHYGNGLLETRSYARIGRLSQAKIGDPRGKVSSQQSYVYDSEERLVEVESSIGQRPFRQALGYDGEGRLTSVTEGQNKKPTHRYCYDAKGNMIEDSGEVILLGDLDQPLKYGNRSVEYDANGNMTQLPGARGDLSCQFTASGLLREARSGSSIWSFKYDALGRRMLKTNGVETWRFGWAGHQLLWEEYQVTPEASALRRDYLLLPDSLTPLAFREQGRTYWLQTDVRGAVIHAFDEAGETVWKASYDAFGEAKIEVAAIRQPWRLSGQYCDTETGLHYSLARYYAPHLKSFISRDPKWQHPEATNYSYARNSPWNYQDPNGGLAFLIPVVIFLVSPVGRAVVGAVVGGIVGAVSEGLAGGDPVAGAVEGAISMAADFALPGELSVPASGFAAGAGEVVRQWRRGDEICWDCVAQVSAEAMAFDALMGGFGSMLSPTAGARRAAQGVAADALTEGAEKAAKGSAKGLRRPYIRKKVREKAESRARKAADGRFLDHNTGKPIDGKYDLGHKKGREFRREKAAAEREGLSQKEFNDRMNDADLYQIEDPSSNRSHKFEKPGND